MPIHVAQVGDCISSIAIAYGLPWEEVWNHGSNARLRQLRRHANVLQPGDEVFVPTREDKQESGATSQRHVFRIKGVPARLRLRITHELLPEGQTRPPAPPRRALHLVDGDPEPQDRLVDPNPRANVPFVLVVDGTRRHTGNTDGDGRIDVPIWPGARSASLTLSPGTPEETQLTVDLGHLDPLDSVPGVKQRLQNLGYPCGSVDDAETDGYAAALRAFQAANGLPTSGRADDATRAALRDRHGV